MNFFSNTVLSNFIRSSPQKGKFQSSIFYRIFFPEHAGPLPGDCRVAAVPVVAADGGRPGPGDDVVRPRQDGRGLRAADAAVGAVDDLGDLAVVGEAMVRQGVAVVRAVTALRTGERRVC